MAGDGSFLVEEFLGAITSQLDRTQDALKAKAVNRPLTYAIKDFDMELKVFVDMDAEGKVRFRAPAVGESGASSIKIGFTTITRPMIEENTVEMAQTSSPTLAEAGVPEPERRRLEALGVRNTAELQRLGRSAGANGVARMSNIPVDQLRAALAFGRPQVSGVRPATQKPPAVTPKPVAQAPVTPPPNKIFVPPGSGRIELVGRNMLGAGGPPRLRLAGAPLSVAEADDERIVADLPPGAPLMGTLEVDHGNGDVETYELETSDPWAPAGA